MKSLFFPLVVLFFVSCTSSTNESTENKAETQQSEMKERAIGFALDMEDSKFHLGTEEAIDVVKEFDRLWVAKDYDGMRALMVDTATTYFSDGQIFKSADAAIKAIKEEDMDGESEWTFDYAFSVDLDPTRGGEHVQAGFTVNTTKDGEERKRQVHESYYVIEGKIVWYSSFAMEVKEQM